MPIGIIQFYLEEKGYGYVRIPETREEFHVHRRYLQSEVQKGDEVEFEIKEGKQGQYAVNVRHLKPPGEQQT
jgi:cold shock CspA family protein